jgi:hypothetical protein
MLEEISNIKKDIEEYIEVKFDLFRLQTAENISRILSNSVTAVIFICLLCIILLFLSFAAGYFCASLLNSNGLGFLCVAGFYGLILAIFMILRKRIIQRPIIKAVVKLFFPKSGDNEKDLQ